MSTPLAEQYEAVEQTLLKRALELVRNGDVGALSVWFTTARFRPASAFRKEHVNYVSKKGTGRNPLGAAPGHQRFTTLAAERDQVG